MADMNTVSVMGRLTADVELKTTPSGKSVATFSVANDAGYGDNQRTNFFRCVAWDKNAEFIERYFRKGNRIAITGELAQRTYTDKSGNKREAVEIIVRNAHFCESKGNSSPAPAPAPAAYTAIDDDDDLPF